MKTLETLDRREWLEVDGHGGYASGTASGLRTRRYHALLLSPQPRTGERFVLVSGFDALVETAAGRFPLSTNLYGEGVVSPSGFEHIEGFTIDPWPRWTFRLPDGTGIEQAIFMRHGRAQTFVTWRVLPPVGRSGHANGRVMLHVRPFLAARDYHGLERENDRLRADYTARPHGAVRFAPHDGVPAFLLASNGWYNHAPDWYRRFRYPEERLRGLDDEEDLVCPGELNYPLGEREAVLVAARDEPGDLGGTLPAADTWVAEARAAEATRRARLGDVFERSADAYIVQRGGGRTILAGYPWFTDWGRDTFISVRGLCLATGRLEDARAILSRWAGSISQGMLPNRFPDRGDVPEYNAVDASLWYVVAVLEYLTAAGGVFGPEESERRRLIQAVETILTGYANGTRYGIRATDDGLLAAGERGWQLTWMDARTGEGTDRREVTPRIGKPVEVQALWLNALFAGLELRTRSTERWRTLLARGRESFAARFPDPTTGGLYDVVDVDHRPGAVDRAVRPNQIYAVGGLPMPLLDGERARAVVDLVERRLLTPLGLRTLAPGEPGYRPRYEGGPTERDGAYHMGTAWPFLLGPFVEAWVRVRGGTAQAKLEARERFLSPIYAHLAESGIGHVSELADAQPPHHPAGCPFQAWSLAEIIRLDRVVLAHVDTSWRPGGAARGRFPGVRGLGAFLGGPERR